MSVAQPYIVVYDDDDPNNSSESELELLDDDSDSEPEITAVYAKPQPSASTGRTRKKKSLRSAIPTNGPILFPHTELPSYNVSKGFTIRPGDTVELVDHSSHEVAMHSADFLRVRHIIRNQETREVKLRGHRLRRTKYLEQIFDWKLNELSMVLHLNEGDRRCPLIAGMEEVPIDEVLRPRDCVLTNKPYPLMSFRHGPLSFAAGMSNAETKLQIFHGGKLACRVMNIVIISANGKPYSGVIRFLHAKDADIAGRMIVTSEDGKSSTSSIPIDDDDENVADATGAGLSGKGKRRARSASFIVNSPPQKRSFRMPTNASRYTFADAFCGAGGASQGAKEAELHIVWGLDLDELALDAYSRNHPGALAFPCNAHDFPPKGYEVDELKTDVLHCSPPCQSFSPANNRGGRNDQANMEALYTVGALLTKLQPRIVTLEQTYGLSTYRKHKHSFLMLLYDIGQAGYDIRYTMQKLSKFGLVQERKRLLIVAARRGTPLPPLPQPTHGPPGSGLAPFRTIHDALIPIQRLANRYANDPYHEPELLREPGEPSDPHALLKACITTSGGAALHFSGKRKYTPRELALLQSFPYDYRFTGKERQATHQIGNAFPPIMAGKMFRIIAKTLEAFDHKLIRAEDDLSNVDLDAIPSTHARALAAPSRSREMSLPYRYLAPSTSNNNNARHMTASATSPFARRQDVRPMPSRNGKRAAFSSMGLADGLLENNDLFESQPDRSQQILPDGVGPGYWVAIDGNENDRVWISTSA